MRRKVTVERLRQFMEELAASARSPGKIYFTGGATALLLGFREQTIDVDIKLDPEPEGVSRRYRRYQNWNGGMTKTLTMSGIWFAVGT